MNYQQRIDWQHFAKCLRWLYEQSSPKHSQQGAHNSDSPFLLLPWRDSENPYWIIVSEFMLQQTRVNTVLPYFAVWIDRFATWDSLANAALNEVLYCWQGLGYYNRAVNLHNLAKILHQSKHHIASEKKELLSLPGVGEYTANAILSLVHKQEVLAIDTNVRRVISRIFGMEPTKLANSSLDHKLQPIFRFLPSDIVNQGLMDIGRIYCTKKQPKCNLCVLKQQCHYNLNPDQQLDTTPVKKKTFAKLQYFIWYNQNKILVQKSVANGWWKNLYSFPYSLETGPTTKTPASKPKTNDTKSANRNPQGSFQAMVFFFPDQKKEQFKALNYCKKAFVTHYSLQVEKYFLKQNTAAPLQQNIKKIFVGEKDGYQFFWVDAQELANLPMPSPMKASWKFFTLQNFFH